jgi:hypothetical protein
MLLTNDRAVERAIIAIWKKQTSSEQLAQSTQEHNHVGFTAFDAEFLSSLAERLEWKKYALTPKQLASGRKAILKYAGQLTSIANSR